MMNRKELNFEEMDMINGGVNYNAVYFPNAEEYRIYNADTGEYVTTCGTKHGVEAFMDEHPDDSVTILENNLVPPTGACRPA